MSTPDANGPATRQAQAEIYHHRASTLLWAYRNMAREIEAAIPQPTIPTTNTQEASS